MPGFSYSLQRWSNVTSLKDSSVCLEAIRLAHVHQEVGARCPSRV